MSNFYTTAQKNALNSFSPAAKAAGLNAGDELELIRQELASGNLGIEADAGDVDSLAKGGLFFSRDPDNDVGLTFGYKAGHFWTYNGFVEVSANTIVLAASQTNYIECDLAGVVSKNTAGFTAGRVPMFKVLTGPAGFAEADVSNEKPLLVAPPNGGWPGSLLSTPARTKQAQFALGTITATKVIKIKSPSAAAHLSKLSVIAGTGVATSDADYWTVSAQNKGPTGAGATDMLNITAVNTTKATGGSAITANVARNLTLIGTSANLDTAADDAISVALTKTGAADNLVDVTVVAEWTFNG